MTGSPLTPSEMLHPRSRLSSTRGSCAKAGAVHTRVARITSQDTRLNTIGHPPCDAPTAHEMPAAESRKTLEIVETIRDYPTCASRGPRTRSWEGPIYRRRSGEAELALEMELGD